MVGSGFAPRTPSSRTTARRRVGGDLALAREELMVEDRHLDRLPEHAPSRPMHLERGVREVRGVRGQRLGVRGDVPAPGFRLPAIGLRLSAYGYRLTAIGYRLTGRRWGSGTDRAGRR